MLYINNNDTIISNDGPVIHAGNRGYLYGDGVFESIRIIDGRLINLKNHIDRMLEGAKKIMMRLPGFYNVSFFEERIKVLIEKSEIYEGGRCRVSLDRATGGTYSPESNEVEFLIEVYPVNENKFVLNQKGIEVDLFMEHKKPKTKLSNFKTKNGLIYILAAIEAEKKGLDDLLLVNEKGEVLESTSANLFIVSNGVLYTPKLEDGCLAGTMRMQVINLAIANGIKVYECSIMPQNLLVADEIFLTNAIKGIVWISGYRTKRYFNNTSKKIIDALNTSWGKSN
ncbi:MAG: aminotransferase class IV [Crocinitomicaceae bacterium]|nr:aminotransferase class IV [Crocinitomicaceae bacterium]MDG1777252.1 aminotransferase class IV [Crocinitomicaceae bacterium]